VRKHSMKRSHAMWANGTAPVPAARWRLMEIRVLVLALFRQRLAQDDREGCRASRCGKAGVPVAMPFGPSAKESSKHAQHAAGNRVKSSRGPTSARPQ